MAPIDRHELASALDTLDGGSRAVLDLTLRRGIHDWELASLTDSSEADVRKRRDDAIGRLADALGRKGPEGLAEVRAAVCETPAAVLRPPGEVAAADGEGDRAVVIRSAPKRFLHENGLSIFFLVIFLAALAGQAVAGYHLFNEDAVQHGSDVISFGRYLVSSDFTQATLENWQSEYLQFILFIATAIWLVQRGSPESKTPEDGGLESDEEQMTGEHARSESPRWAYIGGLRQTLYSNSLLILMTVIFLACWLGQSIGGWNDHNADLIDHELHPITWWQYLGSSHFWSTTLQNWQSEFLAVGSFVIFTVFLRQRGSGQSKPVGAPHRATSIEG